MEKIISDLKIFENYKERQVVLNYYEEEDYLIQRNGFHFHSVKLVKSGLLFSKMDGDYFTITLPSQATMYVNNQFPNYYILKSGTDRLEIYFPQ